MGRRSRKRSFPFWEKKHLKRAAQLRRRVLRMYSDAFTRIVDAPSPLLSEAKRFAISVQVPVARFAVGREVTHGQ